MSSQTIRPVALGVIRRGEEVLVSELYDPNEDYHFYRPLGGGIEFGELGHETLKREFDEELGVELTNISKPTRACSRSMESKNTNSGEFTKRLSSKSGPTSAIE